MSHTFDIDKFFRGYIECALWSSNDECGEPLDAVFSADDIAAETLAAMRADCEDFINANASDLSLYAGVMSDGVNPVELRAGHDFWLTRNGHGSGFWDRGLGALGERLTGAAKVYSEFDLYVGDDGLIYS